MKAEELRALLRLTERYCVVFQTLVYSPALTLTSQLAGAAERGQHARQAP